MNTGNPSDIKSGHGWKHGRPKEYFFAQWTGSELAHAMVLVWGISFRLWMFILAQGMVLAQRMGWVDAKGMVFGSRDGSGPRDRFGPRDGFSSYGIILAQGIVVVQRDGFSFYIDGYLLKRCFWNQEWSWPKEWF